MSILSGLAAFTGIIVQVLLVQRWTTQTLERGNSPGLARILVDALRLAWPAALGIALAVMIATWSQDGFEAGREGFSLLMAAGVSSLANILMMSYMLWAARIRAKREGRHKGA